MTPDELCDLLATGCTLPLGHEGECQDDPDFVAAHTELAMSVVEPPPATALAVRRNQAEASLAQVAAGLDLGQLEAAADVLREVFGGARRVVVVGDRVGDRIGPGASEPNLHGADGLARGHWDPAARSVHGVEPAAGEANEFGEGASVQGYTEAERLAAFKAFLGVRRALAEMLEAPDPRAFFGKLREAVGHVDRQGADRMLGMVERMLQLGPGSEP